MSSLPRLSRLSARARKRTRQRGSLIVETLVVVPMLVSLMGVGWWFWDMHTAQMQVYRESAEPVFATATYSCGQAGETSHSFPGPQSPASVSGGSVPLVPADFSKVYEAAPGAPNEEVITRSISDAKADANAQTDGFGAIWFNPNGHSYKASAKMLCNEAVHDGQLDTTKRIAAAVFDP